MNSSGFIEQLGRTHKVEELKPRLKNILSRVLNRRGGEISPGTPAFYSDELFKIVGDLRESDQLRSWPTPQAGKKVRFMYYDAENEPQVSEEVTIPKRPAPFIAALEAYIAGASWEEVQAILTTETEEEDSKIVLEIKERIKDATSYKEIGNAIAVVMNTLERRDIREEALRNVTRRLDKIIETRARECATFEELAREQADIKSLFTSYRDAKMSMTSALDTLDDAAVELAHFLFERTKSAKELDAAVQSLSSFNFTFEDLSRKPIDAKAEDVRAKINFLHTLRYVRSNKGLAKLEAEVSNHQFKSADTTDAYRTELIELIAKKREKYDGKWRT